MATKFFYLRKVTVMACCIASMHASAQNVAPYWSTSGNNNATTLSAIGTTNAVPLRLITRNAERLRIDTFGRIGIGTTSPAQQLHVIGNGTFTGNLGLGTAVPAQKLHVVGNGLFTGTMNATGSYLLNNVKVLETPGLGNTFTGVIGNTTNTGTYISFYGAGTGRANASGSGNVAFGSSALGINSNGNENTALGRSSLFNNIGGSNNVAVGNFAMAGNSLSGNTAVGYFALGNTRSAEGNIAVGYLAGNNQNNGYNNCFLGANTGASFAGLYNMVAIGQGTICTGSSQVTLGNSATGSYRAYANWTNISDGRFKKNIQDNVPGLAFINKLKPVTYNLDATGLNQYLNPDEAKKSGMNDEGQQLMEKARKEKEAMLQTGFIAQDVERAAKEIGFNFSGVDAATSDQDLYGLKYAEFVVPLTKAVQELSADNEDLKKEVAELKAMVMALAKKNGMDASTVATAYIKQNVPNPAQGSTIISYYIPVAAANAEIRITDAKGVTIKSYIPVKGEGQLTIQNGELTAGTYHYTLYVGNKYIATKQLIWMK